MRLIQFGASVVVLPSDTCRVKIPVLFRRCMRVHVHTCVRCENNYCMDTFLTMFVVRAQIMCDYFNFLCGFVCSFRFAFVKVY